MSITVKIFWQYDLHLTLGKISLPSLMGWSLYKFKKRWKVWVTWTAFLQNFSCNRKYL